MWRRWIRDGHRVFDRAGPAAPAADRGAERARARRRAGARGHRRPPHRRGARAAWACPRRGIGMVPGWSGTQRLVRRFGRAGREAAGADRRGGGRGRGAAARAGRRGAADAARALARARELRRDCWRAVAGSRSSRQAARQRRRGRGERGAGSRRSRPASRRMTARRHARAPRRSVTSARRLRDRMRWTSPVRCLHCIGSAPASRSQTCSRQRRRSQHDEAFGRTLHAPERSRCPGPRRCGGAGPAPRRQVRGASTGGPPAARPRRSTCSSRTSRRRACSWKDVPDRRRRRRRRRMTVLQARVAAGNPPTAMQMLGSSSRTGRSRARLGDLTPIAAEGRLGQGRSRRRCRSSRSMTATGSPRPSTSTRPTGSGSTRRCSTRSAAPSRRTGTNFVALDKKFKAAGVIPLAHGGQAWQDATIFDGVVLSAGGPDFYKKAFIELDEAALDSPTR